jgi:hypothetical protein
MSFLVKRGEVLPFEENHGSGVFLIPNAIVHEFSDLKLHADGLYGRAKFFLLKFQF